MVFLDFTDIGSLKQGFGAFSGYLRDESVGFES